MMDGRRRRASGSAVLCESESQQECNDPDPTWQSQPKLSHTDSKAGRTRSRRERGREREGTKRETHLNVNLNLHLNALAKLPCRKEYPRYGVLLQLHHTGEALMLNHVAIQIQCVLF